MSDFCYLADEDAMLSFGAGLNDRFQAGDLVVLEGNLGAGKSTLVRGFLQGLGYTGAVPSPTYTLLEPYKINGLSVVHMDLYRLKSADELEMLGIRDVIGRALCFVEWPDRAAGLLPKPDWRVEIEHVDEGRRIRVERVN